MPELMRNMVWMGPFTGLRVSEVSSLRWADIDASHSRLRVKEIKSGRLLEIPITGS